MMFLLCGELQMSFYPYFAYFKPFFDRTKAPPRDAVQSTEDIAHE